MKNENVIAHKYAYFLTPIEAKYYLRYSDREKKFDFSAKIGYEIISMVFKDRHDAGVKLAKALKKYKSEDVVIQAIARGGVVVGFELAKALNAPLNVIAVRKIGAPFNPEFGIGAIAASGISYIDLIELDRQRIPKTSINEIAQNELIEARRREKMYTKNRPYHTIRDKVVILTDDGLATGVTIKAALLALQKQSPKRIILAIPAGPTDTINELINKVSDIIVLEKRENLSSVGEFYAHFPQCSDHEIVTLLELLDVNEKKVAQKKQKKEVN